MTCTRCARTVTKTEPHWELDGHATCIDCLPPVVIR